MKQHPLTVPEVAEEPYNGQFIQVNVVKIEESGATSLK